MFGGAWKLQNSSSFLYFHMKTKTTQLFSTQSSWCNVINMYKEGKKEKCQVLLSYVKKKGGLSMPSLCVCMKALFCISLAFRRVKDWWHLTNLPNSSTLWRFWRCHVKIKSWLFQTVSFISKIISVNKDFKSKAVHSKTDFCP